MGLAAYYQSTEFKIVKSQHQNDGSDPLSRTLQDWKVNAPLPPNFQDAVWRKIETGAQKRLGVAHEIQLWIDRLFARPASAALCVAILLSLGMTAGWSQGHRESVRVKDELALRYVHSVDPYLTPRP